eukprot:7632267-Alexandrium_andersonii.AAC.1
MKPAGARGLPCTFAPPPIFSFRSARRHAQTLPCSAESVLATTGHRLKPVSYTHLTLPTICSV